MRLIAIAGVLAIGCGGGSTAPAECGDGFITGPDEECDDGNDGDGDGCSADCQLETCGNGIVDPGEQCDDFNTLDGDGCSVECNVEACGNGIIDLGEECDDGNVVDGDGCESDCQTDAATINAKWRFRDLATASTTPCPAGFNTTAFHADASGTSVIDLFDCVVLLGRVELPPDVYQVSIEITNFDNSQTYATSIPAEVDIRLVDQEYAVDILNDGGYFTLAWTLRDASTNTALSCAQVAALDSIEITSTGGTSVVSDKLDCAAGTGITAGLLADTYVTSVAALNALDEPLGQPQNKANQTIVAPNKVTDAGAFDLPID